MISFIKYNYKNNDTFIQEANNLKLLSQYLDSDYIKTPAIINVSREKLELQKVNTKPATNQLMTQLGIGLAKLHQQPFKEYGFESSNFIGLNIQKNVLSDNWGAFFFEYRLWFQTQLIVSSSIRHLFEEVLMNKKEVIIEFLNSHCEHPSLVHGDLWSGNVLFDSEHAWLIDPSSYFADREVDIAMSELFLGFSTSFYEAYNETYALSAQYERKKVIYNLYHLLNHYNLFGHAYLEDCQKSLKFIDSLS